jgi:Smg protein
MFEVLMYLFENYMDGSVALNADHDTIVSELEQADFTRHEIARALDWLDGLNRVQETVQSSVAFTAHSLRHYNKEELAQLSVDGWGFLLYLEQLCILDPLSREVDNREVDVGRIKWVVLIALFNQPEKKAALTLLQDMIMSEAVNVLH